MWEGLLCIKIFDYTNIAVLYFAVTKASFIASPMRSGSSVGKSFYEIHVQPRCIRIPNCKPYDIVRKQGNQEIFYFTGSLNSVVKNVVMRLYLRFPRKSNSVPLNFKTEKAMTLNL